uniref:Uncharacterized protein n=1 Tax=Trypanosoma congolense (strain IL3000) TaxID=1068625 RepID=G0UXT6_TRYCI|nr:conserved hypothetical protein [Trypanosoma congolense IL3000]
MCELDVFSGKALQLRELPERLRGNEQLLSEFFSCRFEGTPAAHVKSIVLKNSDGKQDTSQPESVPSHKNVASEECRDSLCTDVQAVVVFHQPEGVRFVLSKIIQHEVRERDERQHIELQRGYVYLGRDRLLVEGVVHTLSCDSVAGEANSVSKDSTAANVPVHSTATLGNGTAFTETGGAQEEYHTTYGKKEGECVTDLHCNRGDTARRTSAPECREDPQPSTPRDDMQRSRLRQDQELNSVVLCMTFVCISDNSNYGDEGVRGASGDFGVSVHLIFKLLRGTCLARQIVMLDRDASGKGANQGANNKQRRVRALVEVCSKEDAIEVVNEFHESIVELIAPGSATNEVEFRLRVYVAYDSTPASKRQLVVSMNTNTELSITPKNLSQMGEAFRCERFYSEGDDRSARCTGAGVWKKNFDLKGAGLNGQDESYNRRTVERSVGHPSPEHRADPHETKHRCLPFSVRQRERSLSSGYRSRSPSNYQRRRNHRRDDMYRRCGGQHAPSDFAEVPIMERATASALSQQRHLEESRVTLGGSNMHNCSSVSPTVTLHQQDSRPQLAQVPSDWRVVFSEEYQRNYYVFCDPVTGQQTSSWELPPMATRLCPIS